MARSRRRANEAAAFILPLLKSPARLLDWSFREPYGEHPASSTSWFRRPAPKPTPSSPSLTAVTDFCHALLNSNEFLYLH